MDTFKIKKNLPIYLKRVKKVGLYKKILNTLKSLNLEDGFQVPYKNKLDRKELNAFRCMLRNYICKAKKHHNLSKDISIRVSYDIEGKCFNIIRIK